MPFNPVTQPVDYILLADRKSPGLAEVLGAASLREWVERNGYGLTGGFSTFKRRKLAHFSVKLRLYTAQDWADWHAWKALVDKLPTRRGGDGPASGYLKIDHPILADLDIKAAGVEKVSQPEQTNDGEWTITIDFIEFRSPKVTLAKPEGAKATPVDPYDAQIEALEQQFNALAGR
jgi:hypothetical protein